MVGGRSFFQYGEIVRSFAPVFFLLRIVFSLITIVSLFHRKIFYGITNFLFGSAVFDPI